MPLLRNQLNSIICWFISMVDDSRMNSTGHVVLMRFLAIISLSRCPAWRSGNRDRTVVSATAFPLAETVRLSRRQSRTVPRSPLGIVAVAGAEEQIRTTSNKTLALIGPLDELVVAVSLAHFLDSSLNPPFLLIHRVITGGGRNRKGLENLWIHKITMTPLSSTLDESRMFQVPNQFTSLPWPRSASIEDFRKVHSLSFVV